VQQGDQDLLLSRGPLPVAVVRAVAGPDVGQGVPAIQMLRPGGQVEAGGLLSSQSYVPSLMTLGLTTSMPPTISIIFANAPRSMTA